jgi:hypothetical protein
MDRTHEQFVRAPHEQAIVIWVQLHCCHRPLAGRLRDLHWDLHLHILHVKVLRE